MTHLVTVWNEEGTPLPSLQREYKHRSSARRYAKQVTTKEPLTAATGGLYYSDGKQFLPEGQGNQ